MVQGQIINDYSDSLFTVSFTDHWLAYQDVFTAWFLPNEIPVWIRIILVWVVTIFLLIYYYRNYKMAHSQKNMFGVIAILFTSYFLLTYIASFIVNEFIDDRILAPAYIPGILLLFGLADRYIHSIKNPSLKKICLYLCLLWAIYPITRSIVNSYTWHYKKVELSVSQPVEADFYKFLIW